MGVDLTTLDESDVQYIQQTTELVTDLQDEARNVDALDGNRLLELQLRLDALEESIQFIVNINAGEKNE